MGVEQRLRARIERSCAAKGLTYPWWIPLCTTLGTLAFAGVGFVQRCVPGAPLDTTWLALALMLTPVGYWFAADALMPLELQSIVVLVSILLFIRQPVDYPDGAPFALVVSTGEVAAVLSWRTSVVVTLVNALAVVVVAPGRLPGSTLYVVGLVIGALVGVTLQWYMRALALEQGNVALAAERARSQERQRVAREVHDVIGHSLSINLLHVTAARHALQQHADVQDAIESLTEAERVGRDAMADLRRSVATLGEGGASPRSPQPGLGEIEELIARSCAAGLDIRYEAAPSAPAVSEVTGLAVYRIVQESLANVAKHAPVSQVRVLIGTDGDHVRVSVRNTLPPGTTAAPDGGSGLAGMAERARQLGGALRAGVDGDHWVVALDVPGGAP